MASSTSLLAVERMPLAEDKPTPVNAFKMSWTIFGRNVAEYRHHQDLRIHTSRTTMQKSLVHLANANGRKVYKVRSRKARPKQAHLLQSGNLHSEPITSLPRTEPPTKMILELESTTLSTFPLIPMLWRVCVRDQSLLIKGTGAQLELNSKGVQLLEVLTHGARCWCSI